MRLIYVFICLYTMVYYSFFFFEENYVDFHVTMDEYVEVDQWYYNCVSRDGEFSQATQDFRKHISFIMQWTKIILYDL
jgi:hypothetical protein